MVIIMLYNWNHKYYSYYKIIKYVDFELIIYAINLDVIIATPSFKVFNEFDFMLLSSVLLV